MVLMASVIAFAQPVSTRATLPVVDFLPTLRTVFVGAMDVRVAAVAVGPRVVVHWFLLTCMRMSREVEEERDFDA